MQNGDVGLKIVFHRQLVSAEIAAKRTRFCHFGLLIGLLMRRPILSWFPPAIRISRGTLNHNSSS